MPPIPGLRHPLAVLYRMLFCRDSFADSLYSPSSNRVSVALLALRLDVQRMLRTASVLGA